MGDREREGLQSLVGLLQIPGPLLVGDVPLEGLAALAIAPGIEPVLSVAAFTVLGRLGPVLGGPGPAALDIGPDVDPLLGVVGVTALGVGLDVDPLLGSRASRRWVSAWTSIRSWASRASRRWVSTWSWTWRASRRSLSMVPSA